MKASVRVRPPAIPDFPTINAITKSDAGWKAASHLIAQVTAKFPGAIDMDYGSGGSEV